VKLVLEIDLSGEEFRSRGSNSLVLGESMGLYLTRVAKRMDGHSMAAGENGKIVSDDDEVLGSWKIEP